MTVRFDQRMVVRVRSALTGVWALAAVGCSQAPAPLMADPVAGTQGTGGMAAVTRAGAAGTAGARMTTTAAAGAAGKAKAPVPPPPVVPTRTIGRPATRRGAGSQPDSDAGVSSPQDASVASPDAATASAPRADLGKGDGSDVITIGDSWMSLSAGSGIEDSLLKASGQKYRTYAVAGTQLLNGQIPGQFTRAKMANPDIKTVVMTGGGNDIVQTGLLAECDMGGPRCAPQLMKIGEGLAALWKQMGADGVKDVIHVEYARVTDDGVKDPDAYEKMLADLCTAATPVHCHLLNTDAQIPSESDLRDGLHPTNAGYDRIGQAVFELMVEQGMRR